MFLLLFRFLVSCCCCCCCWCVCVLGSGGGGCSWVWFYFVVVWGVCCCYQSSCTGHAMSTLTLIVLHRKTSEPWLRLVRVLCWSRWSWRCLQMVCSTSLQVTEVRDTGLQGVCPFLEHWCYVGPGPVLWQEGRYRLIAEEHKSASWLAHFLHEYLIWDGELLCEHWCPLVVFQLPFSQWSGWQWTDAVVEMLCRGWWPSEYRFQLSTRMFPLLLPWFMSVPFRSLCFCYDLWVYHSVSGG